MSVSFVLKVYIPGEDAPKRKTIRTASLSELSLREIRQAVCVLAPDADLSKLTWEDAEGHVSLRDDDDLQEALCNLHRMSDGKEVLRIHVTRCAAIPENLGQPSTCGGLQDNAAADLETAQRSEAVAEVPQVNGREHSEEESYVLVKAEVVTDALISDNGNSMNEEERSGALGESSFGAPAPVECTASSAVILTIGQVESQLEPPIKSLATSANFLKEEEVKDEEVADEGLNDDGNLGENNLSTDYIRAAISAVPETEFAAGPSSSTAHVPTLKRKRPSEEVDSSPDAGCQPSSSKLGRIGLPSPDGAREFVASSASHVVNIVARKQPVLRPVRSSAKTRASFVKPVYYQCHLCPMRMVAASRRQHVRTHSDYYQFGCNFCEYGSKHNSMDVRKHIEAHHAEFAANDITDVVDHGNMPKESANEILKKCFPNMEANRWFTKAQIHRSRTTKRRFMQAKQPRHSKAARLRRPQGKSFASTRRTHSEGHSSSSKEPSFRRSADEPPEDVRKACKKKTSRTHSMFEQDRHPSCSSAAPTVPMRRHVSNDSVRRTSLAERRKADAEASAKRSSSSRSVTISKLTPKRVSSADRTESNRDSAASSSRDSVALHRQERKTSADYLSSPAQRQRSVSSRTTSQNESDMMDARDSLSGDEMVGMASCGAPDNRMKDRGPSVNRSAKAKLGCSKSISMPCQDHDYDMRTNRSGLTIVRNRSSSVSSSSSSSDSSSSDDSSSSTGSDSSSSSSTDSSFSGESTADTISTFHAFRSTRSKRAVTQNQQTEEEQMGSSILGNQDAASNDDGEFRFSDAAQSVEEHLFNADAKGVAAVASYVPLVSLIETSADSANECRPELLAQPQTDDCCVVIPRLVLDAPTEGAASDLRSPESTQDEAASPPAAVFDWAPPQAAQNSDQDGLLPLNQPAAEEFPENATLAPCHDTEIPERKRSSTPDENPLQSAEISKRSSNDGSRADFGDGAQSSNVCIISRKNPSYLVRAPTAAFEESHRGDSFLAFRSTAAIPSPASEQSWSPSAGDVEGGARGRKLFADPSSVVHKKMVLTEWRSRESESARLKRVTSFSRKAAIVVARGSEICSLARKNKTAATAHANSRGGPSALIEPTLGSTDTSSTLPGSESADKVTSKTTSSDVASVSASEATTVVAHFSSAMVRSPSPDLDQVSTSVDLISPGGRRPVVSVDEQSSVLQPPRMEHPSLADHDYGGNASNAPFSPATSNTEQFLQSNSIGRLNNQGRSQIIDDLLKCYQSAINRFIIPDPIYNADPGDLTRLLGLQFAFYQETSNTPPSLYKLTAVLFKDPRMHLGFSSLLTYLKPTQEEILDQHKAVVDAAAKKRRKVSSRTLSNDYQVEEAQNSSVEAEEEKLLMRNQKLMLLLSLIELGDWSHAQELLDHLPEFFAVRFPLVAKRLCTFVDLEIDGLYEELYPPRNFSKSADCSEASSRSHRCEFSVNSLHDFQAVVFPILHYLGLYVAAMPSLVTKLILLSNKLVTAALTVDHLPCLDVVAGICGRVFLPSMTMMRGKREVSEDLWALISKFDYPIRYRLYAEWKAEPLLAGSAVGITARTKSIMRGLSRETVELTGRQLDKLCRTHPAVVFDYILNQFQRYQDVVGPAVDSLEYLSSLSRDVLAHCVVEKLVALEKEEVDAIDSSPCLRSLATFVGAMFRRFNVDPAGVLQHVSRQSAKSCDLIVLRKIIQNMSGIEVSSNSTEHLLEAFAGGDLLTKEALCVRYAGSAVSRLKNALLQGDLAMRLCLTIARQRASFDSKNTADDQLESVGLSIDQWQESLTLFGIFLATILSPSEFAKRMPTVDQLIETHKLGHAVAFFLARPLYAHAISARYLELLPAGASASISASHEENARHYLAACDYVLKPLLETFATSPSLRVWQDISPKFYVTFWTLTMYDLHVPDSAYARQIERAKSLYDKAAKRSSSDSKRREKMQRYCDLEKRLRDDQSKQTQHVSLVLERLDAEKDEWFGGVTRRGALMLNFLRHCILPRCLFTELDALYCAKIFSLINRLKTPNFATAWGFDQIFMDITPTLAGLTENESHHYGRFLCAMLQQVMAWHGDKALFDAECANSLAFATKNGLEDKRILHSASFKHVAFRWHKQLTVAFVKLLAEKNWVLIRNALVVLSKLSPVYPLISDQYDSIETALDKVREEQKRQHPDLYFQAKSCLARLRTKRSTLVLEYDFCDVPPNKRKILQAKRDETSKLTAGKDCDKSVDRPAVASQPPVSGGRVARWREDAPATSPTVPSDTSGEPTYAGAQLPQPAERRRPKLCRYWPDCRNFNQCPYDHPKVPRSPSGERHVSVRRQCKFDPHCRNPRCQFEHASRQRDADEFTAFSFADRADSSRGGIDDEFFSRSGFQGHGGFHGGNNDGSWSFSRSCYRCGEPDHISRNCPNSTAPGDGFGAAGGGYFRGGRGGWRGGNGRGVDLPRGEPVHSGYGRGDALSRERDHSGNHGGERKNSSGDGPRRDPVGENPANRGAFRGGFGGRPAVRFGARDSNNRPNGGQPSESLGYCHRTSGNRRGSLDGNVGGGFWASPQLQSNPLQDERERKRLEAETNYSSNDGRGTR